MIRLAKFDDIKSIVCIVKEIINIEDKKLVNLWDNFYPTEQVFLTDLEKNQLYVFEDNEIKGFVVISHDKENFDDTVFDEEKDYIVVHRLCVGKNFQGNNIAYNIMEYIKDYAIENNKKGIRLDTYSENPITNKFYKKLGYVLKGTMIRPKGIYNVYEYTMEREK